MTQCTKKMLWRLLYSIMGGDTVTPCMRMLRKAKVNFYKTDT
jgi:hypothetical protein